MRINFFNDKYKNDILGKAKTTKIPGLDWQDIAQELDVALWLNLKKFRGDNKSQERTFAIRVMRNKVLDLAKAANRKKRFLDSFHLTFSQLENNPAGIVQLELAQPVFYPSI